jgi:hypothetical protein
VTPRNETQADLQNEQAVAAVLSRAWRVELKKLTEDRLYLADYAAMKDGRVQAFVEIRCRSCGSNTYPTLYMPLHKLLWARLVWDSSNTPYFFVVHFFGDGVIAYAAVHEMDPSRARLGWAVRQTERDTHPDGPVVEIDTQSLRVIAREKRDEPTNSTTEQDTARG